MFAFKPRIIFLYSLTIFLFNSNSLSAQKIMPDVEVKISERINFEIRDKFPDFKNILQEYINSASWTNNEVTVEIPINIEFFFQSATTGAEDNYGVQILISDNADVQYFDRRCSFRYQKGENLQHSDNNWTSLTSLIDFYIYMLLGDEMDKFGHLLGTSYFEKAKLVAEQANFSDARFIFGWEQRNDLIQKILGEEYKKYREMKDFYFYGIYYLNEDIAKARKYCSVAIDMIEEILVQDPEHEQCKKFLSAHYIEIVDLFKGSNNQHIFKKLIEIDPDHADVYEKHID